MRGCIGRAASGYGVTRSLSTDAAAPLTVSAARRCAMGRQHAGKAAAFAGGPMHACRAGLSSSAPDTMRRLHDATPRKARSRAAAGLISTVSRVKRMLLFSALRQASRYVAHAARRQRDDHCPSLPRLLVRLACAALRFRWRLESSVATSCACAALRFRWRLESSAATSCACMLALRPSALLPRQSARRAARPVAACSSSPATSRRRLAGGAAVLLLLGDGGSGEAALAAAATRYTDEDGGFSLLVPAGWTQLQLSPAAREVAGVFASFRDPGEASNTLGGASPSPPS